MQTIMDLIEVSNMVNEFFKNEEKTTIWLNTINPLLGNQIPIDMILAGRTEKLKNFIETQLNENE